MDIEDELAKYSRTRFTLEELSKRPVPEGVDPSKLETYLSDEEFKVQSNVEMFFSVCVLHSLGMLCDCSLAAGIYISVVFSLSFPESVQSNQGTVCCRSFVETD